MFAFPRLIFTFKSPLITEDVSSLAFIMNLRYYRLYTFLAFLQYVDFSYIRSLIFEFLLNNIFKVLELSIFPRLIEFVTESGRGTF